MQKVENSSDTALRVVLLLSLLKNKKYKAAELAEMLDCSERHVHRLINAIRNTGIKVKSKSGLYGGFEIKDDRYTITDRLYIDMLKKLKK